MTKRFPSRWLVIEITIRPHFRTVGRCLEVICCGTVLFCLEHLLRPVCFVGRVRERFIVQAYVVCISTCIFGICEFSAVFSTLSIAVQHYEISLSRKRHLRSYGRMATSFVGVKVQVLISCQWPSMPAGATERFCQKERDEGDIIPQNLPTAKPLPMSLRCATSSETLELWNIFGNSLELRKELGNFKLYKNKVSSYSRALQHPERIVSSTHSSSLPYIVIPRLCTLNVEPRTFLYSTRARQYVRHLVRFIRIIRKNLTGNRIKTVLLEHEYFYPFQVQRRQAMEFI